MSEKKPDGWVAWHPEMSKPITMSKSGSIEQLLRQNYGLRYGETYCHAEAYFAMRDSLLGEAEKDGWRIRPVKIVFLDEEKSDEE